MPAQNFLAELVHFALEHDFHAGVLEADVDAADAAEKRCDFQCPFTSLLFDCSTMRQASSKTVRRTNSL